MIKRSYDLHFMQAVRKCAATLVPKRKSNGIYTDGDALAALLRSDYPLREMEREILAELITGELQRPQGRQGVSADLKSDVVRYYKELRSKDVAEKVAIGKAKNFLQEKYNVKRESSAIRQWVTEAKNVEEIVRKVIKRR